MFIFLIAFVGLTGCGGGSDDALSAGESQPASTHGTPSTSTTSSEATSTAIPATTADSSGQGTDFCEALEADMPVSDDVDALDREAFEERSRENLAVIEELRGSVPRDLEGSYDILLEANRDWLSLLEEFNWDVLTIPMDEPRVLRMGSDEVSEASEAVLEYCGIELVAG